MRSRPIAVVVNDTRVDRHHGCHRVMAAIEALLLGHGFDVGAFAPAHAPWNEEGFVRAAERARLVVVNGEGTLHHDRPAGRRLLEVGAWAKARGIPAALVNAGWEANGPELTAMLRDFALVAVRDSRSAAELAEHGIAARVLPDLSLYGPTISSTSRRGLVFSDSVERSATLKLERARRAMRGRTLAIQWPPATRLSGARYLREVLGRRDVQRPLEAARALRARWSQMQACELDPRAFLERLAAAELLVSGRFHACTLALVTRTPFVAIPSNTHKIEALVHDAGIGAWRASASLAPSDLEAARRVGWSPDETMAVDDYVASAFSKADALFAELARLTS